MTFSDTKTKNDDLDFTISRMDFCFYFFLPMIWVVSGFFLSFYIIWRYCVTKSEQKIFTSGGAGCHLRKQSQFRIRIRTWNFRTGTYKRAPLRFPMWLYEVLHHFGSIFFKLINWIGYLDHKIWKHQEILTSESTYHYKVWHDHSTIW